MKYFLKFIKGLIVGIANIIPGLCSGSVAIILSVYDDMIIALSLDFAYMKKHWFELCLLCIGILFGIFGFSYLISELLKSHYNISIFFFMGLVLGSVPLLFKKAKNTSDSKKKFIKYIWFAAMIALIIGLSFVSVVDNAVVYNVLDFKLFIFLFLAGVIGAVGMIVPGLSGSFLLLLLGLYSTLINAVKNLNFLILLPFALGAVLGLVFGAKFIKLMMKKHPKITYYAIIGLVIGSVFALYPGFGAGINILYEILSLIFGITVSILLSLISKEDEEPDNF